MNPLSRLRLNSTTPSRSGNPLAIGPMLIILLGVWLVGCGGSDPSRSSSEADATASVPQVSSPSHVAQPSELKRTLALPSAQVTSAAVSAGAFHSLALKTNGTVWAWGLGDLNTDGQLGNNSSLGSFFPVQVVDSTGSATLTGVAAISAGDFHSLALKRDGTVWAWGFGELGQLGTNSSARSLVPVQVLDASGTGPLSGVVAISGGGYFSMALKDDGTVWTWGQGFAGQLGNFNTANSFLPVQVMDSTGTAPLTDVRSISAGLWHALAVKNDGTVWAWGYGVVGQLGNGSTASSSVPVQVLDPSGGTGLSDAAEVVAGNFHSLARMQDGTVRAWGLGFNGQIGNGQRANWSLPQPVLDGAGTGLLTNTAKLAAGSFHSLAIAGNGLAWSWGFGADGQLGNNTLADSLRPVPVVDGTGTGLLSNVVSLAGNGSLSLGVRGDGSVWAWGVGALGNTNGYASSGIPVRVLGPLGVDFLNLIVEDTTPPTVTLTTSAASYTVDQNVRIACAATDSESGVVTTTNCEDVKRPAYLFNIGENTVSASATDAAGNTSAAAVHFTVSVTTSSLITLTGGFVANRGIAVSLSSKLRLAEAAGVRGDVRAKAALMAAYVAELRQLPRRIVAADDAAILIRLAAYL